MEHAWRSRPARFASNTASASWATSSAPDAARTGATSGKRTGAARGRSFLLRGADRRSSIAALVAGAIAFVATRGPDYPSAWDARIQPIAGAGRGTARPVVRASRQGQLLAARRVQPAGRHHPRRRRAAPRRGRTAGAYLRSLGLLGAGVDLAREVDRGPGGRAHSPSTTTPPSEISVRGTGPMSVATVRHSRTSSRMSSKTKCSTWASYAAAPSGRIPDRSTRSPPWSKATPPRVQGLYLAGLPPADRDAYALQSIQATNDAQRHTQDRPGGGRDLLRRALHLRHAGDAGPRCRWRQPVGRRRAPAGRRRRLASISTRAPSRTRRRSRLSPSSPTGEKKLASLSDGDDHFDNFTFYLMLARAARSPDCAAGGRRVLERLDRSRTTRNSTTCFRAAVNGVSPQSSTFLATVLGRWAETMPDASVELHRNRRGVPVLRPRCAAR